MKALIAALTLLPWASAAHAQTARTIDINNPIFLFTCTSTRSGEYVRNECHPMRFAFYSKEDCLAAKAKYQPISKPPYFSLTYECGRPTARWEAVR